MFEVIATEGSYVRSLDVLVAHFMEDPGMNPELPDGRRVLNRRQYHVIFSNVREVHEVAKRYDNYCRFVYLCIYAYMSGYIVSLRCG